MTRGRSVDFSFLFLALSLVACGERSPQIGPDATSGADVVGSDGGAPDGTAPTEGVLRGNEVELSVGFSGCFRVEHLLPDGTRTTVPATAELTIGAMGTALIERAADTPWNCSTGQLIGVRAGVGSVLIRWGEVEGSIPVTVTEGDPSLTAHFSQVAAPVGFSLVVEGSARGGARGAAAAGPVEASVSPSDIALSGTIDRRIPMVFTRVSAGSYLATVRWRGLSATTETPLRVFDPAGMEVISLSRIDVSPTEFHPLPSEIFPLWGPPGSSSPLKWSTTLPSVGRCYPIDVSGFYRSGDGDFSAPVLGVELAVVEGAENAHVEGMSVCVDQPGPAILRASKDGLVLESALALGGAELVDMEVVSEFEVSGTSLCGQVRAHLTFASGRELDVDHRFLALFLSSSDGAFLNVSYSEHPESPTLCVSNDDTATPLTSLDGDAAFGGSRLVEVSATFSYP